MTEEIIIDGVDVARCKDYDDGTCCNDDVLTLSCEKANCMYKQLKRLEQENKELKHRNENLRIALSTYEMPEVVKVLTDYRTGELQLQENKLNTYRSALEEIKNNFMCFRSCIIPFHTGEKDKIPHSMADVIQDYCESIMNKINEVLK